MPVDRRVRTIASLRFGRRRSCLEALCDACPARWSDRRGTGARGSIARRCRRSSPRAVVAIRALASAAMTETLKRRTPLYDRHVAAGARLVPFAGWEMPVQYAGIREEHLAVRDGAGVFDVSHMGEIETTRPGRRGLPAAPALQRRREDRRRAARSTRVLCREDGGVLDDLFTYRLGDDRYLTVTNAANHEKDLAWFRKHAAGFDVDGRRPPARLRDARGPGPAGARIVAGLADGELPKRFTHRDADRRRRARRARLRHRLHGRGRRRAAGRARRRATVWDAVVDGRRQARRPRRARHAAPGGLLPPLRQRPDGDRGPIEAGLGWCCKEDTGFIGAEAVRAAREAGPPRSSSRSRSPGRASPARATRSSAAAR